MGQHVFEEFEFHLLGALFDVFLDDGLGGELVGLVRPLVVLEDGFGQALGLLLGQDDVFELDYLGRDDAEDGVEVVEQQVREVVRDHLNHSEQALLDRAERFQVFQRVRFR